MFRVFVHWWWSSRSLLSRRRRKRARRRLLLVVVYVVVYVVTLAFVVRYPWRLSRGGSFGVGKQRCDWKYLLEFPQQRFRRGSNPLPLRHQHRARGRHERDGRKDRGNAVGRARHYEQRASLFSSHTKGGGDFLWILLMRQHKRKKDESEYATRLSARYLSIHLSIYAGGRTRGTRTTSREKRVVFWICVETTK